MEKLFAGPFGVILVIAQAAFFIYLMRGLFDVAGGDDGISRTFKLGRGRPRRATSPRPQQPNASFHGSRDWSRGSSTLETYYDVRSGVMTARIVEGPFAGRRLDDLSRTELMRLQDVCRIEDPESAEYIEAYMRRRFTEADPRAGFHREEPRSPPPPDDGAMTRKRAYAVLGLPLGASDEDIHHAYRALIMKHHPDHGGSHAKAAEINQAKDMLLG